MSDVDSKYVKAVEVLERLTARFEDGEWVLPPIGVLPHEYSPMFKIGRESAAREIAEFGSKAAAIEARRANTPQWQAFAAEHRRLMESEPERTANATFQAWLEKNWPCVDHLKKV